MKANTCLQTFRVAINVDLAMLQEQVVKKKTAWQPWMANLSCCCQRCLQKVTGSRCCAVLLVLLSLLLLGQF